MKRLVIYIIVILVPCICYAGNISENKAYEIACLFFNQSSTKAADSSIKLVWSGLETKARFGTPNLYVFENTIGGFVIVSGSDMVKPILGYSYSSSFDANNIPPNLLWWISEIESGINYLKHKGKKPSNEVKEAWVKAESGFFFSSEKKKKRVLETANWNQSYPFNLLCPKIDGKYTYAGCVPVAFAIVMRYYNWPQSGSGFLGGYEYLSDDTGQKVVVEGYNLGYNYDWNNMPTSSYNPKNKDYTEESTKEIAQLIRDCGMMAQAKYGVTSTGGFTIRAMNGLINHMSYDRNVISTNQSSNSIYFDRQWMDLLARSIDTNHPIIYTGSSGSSGHCFVIDGYDSELNFHINLGWGGHYNGYYAFPNFGDYSFNHFAIFGLKPMGGTETHGIIALMRSENEPGLRIVEEQVVEENKPFTIFVNRLYNDGVLAFSGEVAAGVIDRRGILKEIVSESLMLENLNFATGVDNVTMKCSIKKNISPGDKICLFYKSVNWNKWEPVIYGLESVGAVSIDGKFPLEDITSFAYSVPDRKILISTRENVKWNLKYGEKEITENVNYTNNLLTIDVSSLQPGIYWLQLSLDGDTKIIQFKLGEISD